MDETFFKKFPSLNTNSKENRRCQQLKNEYNNYVKTSKVNRETTRAEKVENQNNFQPNSIFHVDERNQLENERKLESMKIYQKVLQEQINEARQKKELLKMKEEQERFLAERRLQSQIEKLREESQMQLPKSDKSTKDDRNHVYQFFSRSSTTDSGLFGYRSHFDDHERSQTCSKCHQSLEKLCPSCYEEDRVNSSFGSSSSAPFSFNIPQNSIFSNEEEILRNNLRTVEKMTNYQKLYGELRRKKKVKIEEKKLEKKDSLDELLSNAQFAVITGYAKNLLKNDSSESSERK